MIDFNYVILTQNTAQIGVDTYGTYYSGYSGTLPSFVTIPSYTNINGVLYKIIGIAQHAFLSQKSLETIYIPSTIEYLNRFCFQNCKNLTHLIFEDNSKLKTIEMGVFADDSSVIVLDIPSSVQTIGFSEYKFS